LSLDACLWMTIAALTLVVLAYVGTRVDVPSNHRIAGSVLVIAVTIGGVMFATRMRSSFDLTERSRLSLPAAVARGLRELAAPLELEANLDRDDARRRQLETDALFKLRLARPDLTYRTPIDE